jgi:hypothetical protein
MSDLVKKIEDWAIWCHENCVKSEVQETLYEAAAEIERLRVALKDIWHRAPTNGEDVSFAIAKKALAEVNDE